MPIKRDDVPNRDDMPKAEMTEHVSDKLLPDLHPQGDLFICDVADAVLKDDMASMEHPFFSLSKTPDKRVRRYENGDKWLEVTPSVKGLATIYDKDILIYCISQIMAKLNRGESVGRHVKIIALDMLKFINRKTGGTQYAQIIEALERLRGTGITTNIPTGDTTTTKGFGLIDGFDIQHHPKTDRILSLEVTLSDWVFNAIRGQEVLSLHRDYFRLKKPLERRIYEIARKHCGQQTEWKIGIALLKKKCGSQGSERDFRTVLKDLAEGNHLPDYTVSLSDDAVTFANREWAEEKAQREKEREGVKYPVMDPETYHDARQVAPSYDVYFLEQEWRNWWVDSGMPQLFKPEKAFIEFCRKRQQRNPNP
jgi:plasmid replication initiation protein